MPAEGGERQPPERIANGNHEAAVTQQLRRAATCAQPSVSVSQGAGEPLAALLQLALRSSLSNPTPQDSYCSNAGMLAAASSSLPLVPHSSAIGSSDQALASRFDALSLASTDFATNNCLSSNGFGNSLADLESLQALESLAQLSGQLPYENQAQGAPSTSSILTPSDTSLLTALLALQQRQYWQSLSNLNGDLLLASLSGGGFGHGRSHSTSSSPSSLYKTELCRSWQETGSCRYGNKCQFAHGPNELRPIQRHPKYKTEICRTFATTGTCPYGTRCRFIHYFQCPPASTAASLSNLLAQAGIHPSSSPNGGLSYNLQHAGSGSSLDSYLTSYGAGAGLLGASDSLETASPMNYLNAQAASGGVYMPPLPPASASQASSSGLPSLTSPSYAAVPNGIGGSSGLTEQQRRLPVFKTFTDVPSSLPM